MNTETNRELATAPTFDPSAVLREIVAGWDMPDDSDAPAEIDDHPPWPEDAGDPRFTFAELIENEAMAYRAWGTGVGDFLARQMEELGQMTRWTLATTPEEYEARKELWDAEIRDAWEARGFEEGKRHCPCGNHRP